MFCGWSWWCYWQGFALCNENCVTKPQVLPCSPSAASRGQPGELPRSLSSLTPLLRSPRFLAVHTPKIDCCYICSRRNTGATISSKAGTLLFQDFHVNAQVPAAGGSPSAAARSTISSSSSSKLPDVISSRFLLFPLEWYGRYGGTTSSSRGALTACDGDGLAEARAAWASCRLFIERLIAHIFAFGEVSPSLEQLIDAPPSTISGRSSSSVRDCISESKRISSHSSAAAPEQQQRRPSRRSFRLLRPSMKVGVPVPSRPASLLGGGALRRPVVRCREPP